MQMELRKFASSSLASQVAIVLIAALLLWFTGAPFLNHRASASRVTDFSMTLSRATPGSPASSTVQFTTTNIVSAFGTIRLSFDPSNTSPSGASAFTQAYSTATSSDFLIDAGGTPYTVVNSCTAGNEATTSVAYNNGTNEYIEFGLCSGAAAIPATTTVKIFMARASELFFNPVTEQSYVIRLSGTGGLTGDTRVAIINDVTVTASVDTSFTFQVFGTNAGTSVIGTTTTATTTATSIPFGTLPLTRAVTGTQRLSVATNASNGFVVTVYEDQPLTSDAGDIIYLFNNGATSSVPTQWLAPSSTITQYNTYGHFGVTTDDDYLSDQFAGGTKYVGSIITPQIIFEQNGPADGVTTDIGSTTVGYTVQIGPLQAAGDYTNTLRYVATPTF